MRTLLIFAFALISLSATGQKFVIVNSDSLLKNESQTIKDAYRDFQRKYGGLKKLVVSDSIVNEPLTENNELFSVYPRHRHITVNRAQLRDSAFTMAQFRGDLGEEFFLTLAPDKPIKVRPFL